jgi:hypothetical protein
MGKASWIGFAQKPGGGPAFLCNRGSSCADCAVAEVSARSQLWAQRSGSCAGSATLLRASLDSGAGLPEEAMSGTRQAVS